MKRIDLNVDIGEGFPFDRDLIAIATSANVGCGGHAGSTELTAETVRRCLAAGVRVGAHPGLPDRESMGRILPPEPDAEGLAQLAGELLGQVGRVEGATYIKPHGALYNDSASGGWTSGLVSALLIRFRLPLMGLAGTHHAKLAAGAGVPLIREGFADRRMGLDGQLIPRTEPGAFITDEREMDEHVLILAESVDSICLHGDSDHAVENARRIRHVLREAGYRVTAG